MAAGAPADCVGVGARPEAADQPGGRRAGDDPCRNVPGVHAHAQPGVNAVARPRLDPPTCFNAFAHPDRAVRHDMAIRLDAPAGFQVVAAKQVARDLDAARGGDFALHAYGVARLDALFATQRAADFQALGCDHHADCRQVVAAADVPCGTHRCAALQLGAGADAPARLDIAARPDGAFANDAALRLDVAARHDGRARAHARAADNAPACPHQGIDRNALPGHDGARIDNCRGVNDIDLEHVVGGAELVEQPAGVVDTPVGHQGVQHGLVIAVPVVVAQKPFVAAG